MDETINIVEALQENVERLRRVMAMKINVGDTYPGKPQIQRLQSLIDQLEAEIASTKTTAQAIDRA